MDCVKRRLLIRQLIQQHQLLHDREDDDDDEGLLACCCKFFDFPNLNKSTIGHKIVEFFKENTRRRFVAFESCFCTNKNEHKNKNVQVRGKQTSLNFGLSPQSHDHHHHNHHHQDHHHHHEQDHYHEMSRRCFLSRYDISCKSFIKEMCLLLGTNQLAIMIECLKRTGSHITKQSSSSSSSSPSSLSSSSSSCKSQCIVIPKNTFSRLRLSGADPAMVSCLLWRDVEGMRGGLRRLPMCGEVDEGGVCINPCHWSVMTEAYQLFNNVSVLNTTRKWADPWCQIVHRSFYSLNNPKTHITHSWIQIHFTKHPPKSSSESPKKDAPRSKVKAIILERSEQDVFLHNLSDLPIFVRSPNLGSFEPDVVRIEPATCGLIYDARLVDKAIEEINKNTQSMDVSPLKSILLDSVLISFGKGWGEHYRRSSIFHCPSWMEVLLNRI